MNSKTPILLGIASLAAALFLGACGGLDSPDLNTGQVSGKLTGDFKQGVAFAYVLGSPETKVLVGEDGSYTLSHVPVASNGSVPNGKAQVVLFDGDKRADIQIADVKPASRTQADDRDSSTLATARSVVTAVRCSGGASGSNTVYSVDGAALKDDAKGDVATIFPLPPGVFTVRAKLAGFKEKTQSVDVTLPADVQIEMALDLDGGDAHLGCISNGCTENRECDDKDGQCYQCANTTDCGAGNKCDDHVCVPDSGDGRSVCAPCTSDPECTPGSPSQPALCVPALSGGGSVCSYACAAVGVNTDCPSGFACQATSKGNACVASAGCSALFQEFGQSCTGSDQCHSLADPRCEGKTHTTPGYCTSRCSSNLDCPASLGYTCASNVCVK